MAASTQSRSTVVGVFSDRHHAEQAIDELRRTGFRDDQFGIVSRHAEGESAASSGDNDDTQAGEGALTGALAGAGLGALAGLGILAGVIPVVGPAIAGGTLGIILSNAAAGAGLAGLTGALIGAGIPEDEADYYKSELESGRTIVTVHADTRAAEASEILRRHGAYDMQTRGASATAATGSHTVTAATGAACSTGTTTGHARSAAAGETIQVREEELHAHTRPVETGEVRVRKDVVTEHRTIEVPVEREEVVIERHPVHGQATSGEIHAGGEIRIPVKEEQVVVDKQAVVKEEVSVGKRVVRDTEQVTGEVKKEQVRIEREGDVDVDTTGTTKGRKRS